MQTSKGSFSFLIYLILRHDGKSSISATSVFNKLLLCSIPTLFQ